MSWDIKSGGNTAGILRSEYEQGNTPNRSAMISATATTHPTNATQQGTAAQQVKPVMAGVDVNAICFYRWW